MARDRWAAIRRLEAEANQLRKEMGLPEVDYNAGTIKPIPVREWGLQADIERDEDDEMFVPVDDPDDHSLIAVGLQGRLVAGLDLFYDHVDLGVWTEGGEWVVVADVTLDGQLSVQLEAD